MENQDIKSSGLIPGFNLNELRLPQDFGEALGVKKLITRVPVRKPLKTEFFRVREGDDWRMGTMILELKEESETYLVSPGLWNTVPELLKPAMLHTAIDRRNNVFLVPVPLPGNDGRRNPWHQSLAEVVQAAESKWVRCVANKALGGYDMLVAEAPLADPEWPAVTFEELVEIVAEGEDDWGGGGCRRMPTRRGISRSGGARGCRSDPRTSPCWSPCCRRDA